jgi:2-oxoisovalerate dehydrogenase E1 component
MPTRDAAPALGGTTEIDGVAPRGLASAGSADKTGEPITMPFGDLTISEGKIVRWAKADGDPVKTGELVAEIETDKAVVEIEAPSTGRLAIELPVGTVVPMGGRIGNVRKS